jgi:glycosyltransferase involved in cell wall biosynthesis
MTAKADLVSVVIPTHRRADLLLRAVATVLGQTHRNVELIVVIDGPDPDTERALAQVADQRLRWVVNTESAGGSEARNIGVRAATGRWLAFLDDDDEWLPTKLERQVALIESVELPVMVSCRIITRTPGSEFVGPNREPRPGEHLSDYLFRPRRPFARGARLQTSAIMVPRQLALDVPWEAGLRRFQDFDWFLRLAAAGAPLRIVPEPLAIWYFRQNRTTIGGRHARDWRQALEWIDQRRDLVTRRAYSRWVLARVAGLAAAAAEPEAMAELWHKARTHGRAGLADVVQFAAYSLDAHLSAAAQEPSIEGGRSTR